MQIPIARAIRISLVQKINKGEKLSLSEIGMRDVLWGKGRKPDEREFRMPKWIKGVKKNA